MKFILAAKKRSRNATSNYLVTIDNKDMSIKSPNYLGKLRSNFLGTEFTIFDKGLNPKKKEAFINPDGVREQFGVILYASNLLGARGPRKMRIIIP